MAWIKLTVPGGNLIHINVEHVTSVRSDTQIPGAKAQPRFDERETSRCTGKCRPGHAADYGHRRLTREWRMRLAQGAIGASRERVDSAPDQNPRNPGR